MSLSLEQRAALEKLSETAYAVAARDDDGAWFFGSNVCDHDDTHGPLLFGVREDAVDDLKMWDPDASPTMVRVRVVIEEIGGP